ncbi:MAG: acyl-coenzyme A thioesterase PaaI-like protein [Alteromonadaceae bacterium]|jgi:acyl-coenzyme A thioesterase PaaI-like protein
MALIVNSQTHQTSCAMKASNKLSRIVTRINHLPGQLSVTVLSFVFGRLIKFAGTAKIRIDQLEFEASTLTLKNRRKVQNHIGSVHAAATALLGESATGFLIGMHVPDDKIPLLKSMNIDYVKRSNGDLVARATLTGEQIRQMRSEPKGDINVNVVITDEKGNEPVNCQFVWAWVPSRKS